MKHAAASEVLVNLCSGGLDSYLAWKLFVPGAENVYVRISCAYERRELAALDRLSAADPGFRFTEVRGPALGPLETPSGIIPCRNALLLLTAAAHAGSRPGARHVALHLGALAGEINSDKSEEFCAAVQATLNVSWRAQYWTDGVCFSVGSPLRAFTKVQLLQRYVAAGHDLATLGAARSCYDAGDVQDRRHCGRCASCVKRWMAFRAAGLLDPATYSADPARSEYATQARRKALDGTYDARRTAETLAAFAEQTK